MRLTLHLVASTGIPKEPILGGSINADIVARVVKAVERAQRARQMELTNEGRMEAKANGVQFGRKPTIDRGKLLELKQAGKGATEIAKTMGIGRATVYKLLKELDAVMIEPGRNGST